MELSSQVLVVGNRVLAEEDGDIHRVILHDLNDLSINVLPFLLVDGGDTLRKQLINLGVIVAS